MQVQAAGVQRVDPDGFVQIAVGAFDLAGLELAHPGVIVVVRMHAPAGVVRDEQKRVFLRAGVQQALGVGFPVRHEVRNRGTLDVVGIVLGERG